MSNRSSLFNEEQTEESQKKLKKFSISDGLTLRMGSIIKSRVDISKINFLSSRLPSINKSGINVKGRSISVAGKETSNLCVIPWELKNKSDENLFTGQFLANISDLMNEDQLWRCFYVLPELYEDVYSPTVKVRCLQQVPEITGGVLTKDVVSTRLSYLARIPILGDYVYFKLDLSALHIHSIDVLKNFKYIVHLDLSSNFLTDLSVLSYLLYLQYLSVSYNSLTTVLEYDTPQWFLTEVHYKYNSVKKIRDLREFWSITILDLSHNNIKHISGLETLIYLRHLDLSFNHIQRLENLNHLRLLWLDVSYNNISSFEFGSQCGLWTLLHLEYLNINENNLVSMKMFSGCTRLQELRARNNRLSTLLELAVYMRQMRRLIILDLRVNPLCSIAGYKDVAINTFPNLLSLDEEELDPVEQRKSYMDMAPDVNTFSIRRLLRLLYVEQLSRAKVSFYTPPADTTEVPIVVLVGYEAVGKGTLARRLATECSGRVEQALLHTTAVYHSPDHYHQISREKFDDMLLKGEFLTYTEMNGESYALSRKEAYIRGGKIRVACMDLQGALTLKFRGRRPYLILANYADKIELLSKQSERNIARHLENKKRLSNTMHYERSTLQVLLSGRIIIKGIINEIIMNLPEDNDRSDFLLESECSLLKDSDIRQAAHDYIKGMTLLTILDSHSNMSVDEACKIMDKNSQLDASLYSLYKDNQDTEEYISEISGGGQNNSYRSSRIRSERGEHFGRFQIKPDKSFKSVDFTKYTSSTWKGISGAQESAKSSKSVTFTSQDGDGSRVRRDSGGTQISRGMDTRLLERTAPLKSISTKLPKGQIRLKLTDSEESMDEDLWLTFLMETGLLQTSTTRMDSFESPKLDTKVDDHNMMMNQMDYYHKIASCETDSTSIRDDYESIHLMSPGFFWDCVTMDDPDQAFVKMKSIIRKIVTKHNFIEPMFNIDFTDSIDYPNYQERLASIRKQIAPSRLFY